MSPAVVVNERQFASVKEEILPLPERFDWRRAPQRGDVNVAMLIDPPEGDRRVAASAGPVSRHRLWLNADVIHNGLNPIHLTRNLLHTILGLWIRCHAGEIDSILKGCFCSLLNPTSHQQNDQDQKDQTYPAAGAVTPARAVRPSGQRTDKEKDQDDEEYGGHMSPLFMNVFDLVRYAQPLTLPSLTATSLVLYS